MWAVANENRKVSVYQLWEGMAEYYSYLIY